ncbi:hypothetical protein [Hymenobacter sp.]|uniref:hypothetical protein n=1 Tax=Hymenobacter sp. TaxID=1898978 RepID=UPI002D7F8205|nr:hypothetical protein [Hymenobacter sp.]
MMKKLLLGAWLLAGAVISCQPNVPAASRQQAKEAAGLPAATSDSTAAMLALLRQVDLSVAWNGAGGAAMEGFYGPDSYRMSFYFDSVRRDAQRPNVYYVQGRDRFKKVITPFTGTLTVTRVAPLPDTAGLEHANGDRAYTAFTSFVLREDSLRKGAGRCWGRAVLDFQVNARNQATEAGFTGIGLGEGNPTKGCGQVFKGTWQDNQSGRRQPVAWANFYGVIVPDALRKLGLGERIEEVNPKLTCYGWNTIMENDEWWAKSPQPSLSM